MPFLHASLLLSSPVVRAQVVSLPGLTISSSSLLPRTWPNRRLPLALPLVQLVRGPRSVITCPFYYPFRSVRPAIVLNSFRQPLCTFRASLQTLLNVRSKKNSFTQPSRLSLTSLHHSLPLLWVNTFMTSPLPLLQPWNMRCHNALALESTTMKAGHLSPWPSNFSFTLSQKFVVSALDIMVARPGLPLARFKLALPKSFLHGLNAIIAFPLTLMKPRTSPSGSASPFLMTSHHLEPGFSTSCSQLFPRLCIVSMRECVMNVVNTSLLSLPKWNSSANSAKLVPLFVISSALANKLLTLPPSSLKKAHSSLTLMRYMTAVLAVQITTRTREMFFPRKPSTRLPRQLSLPLVIDSLLRLVTSFQTPCVLSSFPESMISGSA